jgi:hypothetical protein
MGDTYRCYLFSIFDEFALDLKVLFDRFSPQGRLFPRETVLLDLLKLLNDPELAHLWAEDETIGWVYQYFNSKEERKKMRDESAAPRNSRELAVRNQFFTPRYVVEFLTDNTLGRIWYEMTQGETGLKDFCRYLVRRPTEIFLKTGEVAPVQAAGDENLSQEELLRQPVYISHRPLKDPRIIRMLDPACGSMHFGLYSFDLYERIYEEAWELELRLGGDAFVREAGMKPLTETYPDKDAFLRDVPRLIIEHNIHGIDIDSRAVQIAGLSLWLRAQRSWHNQGVKPVDRPRITRSNIVCAEPMPEEKDLLREFNARLEVPALGSLVAQVFDKMQLTGVAGSLLKIEEEIHGIIVETKRLWKAVPKHKQIGMFGDATTKPEQAELPIDFTGITDERFWEGAEEKLYQALQEYAEVAGEQGYLRKLFAEDASRGFAFIDLCRKRYDVMVMNPPFGASPKRVGSYFKFVFPMSYYDIYAAFVERMVGMLNTGGKAGCITSKTFFSTSRLFGFRKWLLAVAGLEICADLGLGVLDNATVETAAYTMSPDNVSKDVGFYSLQKVQEREKELLKCVNSFSPKAYSISRRTISEFPNCSFSAYWGSRSLLSIFRKLPKLDPHFAETAAGQMTGDDFRFVRAKWEVPLICSGRWYSFAKGGEFIRYYCDWSLLVDWTESALIEYRKETVRSILLSRRAAEFTGKIALVWNRVSEGFNVRALPLGAKFADKAPAVFPKNNPLVILGVLCSRLMDRLCALQNPNRMFEVRDVSSLPIPTVEESAIERAVAEIIGIKQRWLAQIESSAIFTCFCEKPAGTLSLDDLISKIKKAASDDLNRLHSLQEGIDSLVECSAGLSSTDMEILQEALGDAPPELISPEFDYLLSGCDKKYWLLQILSYSFGATTGRWDIRFATGAQIAIDLPGPFDPLPVCPPGMFQNIPGMPVYPQDVLADYPLRISWSGILVDDEDHTEDIISRIREVIEIIWKEKAGNIEHEACEILGVRSLRDYFVKPSGFFADHLKRYSKSRRQAPIYWPLSTPSGSYTLWIYYHRLNDQTLYTCINDFVEPKLRDIANELSRLRQKAGSRTEEKELESLQDFEMELQAFRDELLRIARLPWKPNLNDGVQITAAPLWKLFQLPKWKKTLKETWEKLEKGDYDWAHLAYSIWPDRVREKCRKDKSLAIAHNLEELYEEPPASAKKKRGKKTVILEKEES